MSTIPPSRHGIKNNLQSISFCKDKGLNSITSVKFFTLYVFKDFLIFNLISLHIEILLRSSLFHFTANAVDVAGKCRGYRWQMPWISLANAVDIAGKCRGLGNRGLGQKKSLTHKGVACGER